jgi:uncharacterized protein YndB with AHSA1/START domain/DNA-binding transcriptional ArsR family regulator
VTDDDRVFKALADPTRRFLLDRLYLRDGRTLTELESELEMTRFGVMKHLRVLEEADLVVTRRSGREKLHFLNPVPIRLIHDRWIDKYTERRVSALADLKNELERSGMPTMSEPNVATTQVYRVYIRATPEAIWEAITRPEWTARYGYGGNVEYDLRAGGAFRVHASDEFLAAGSPEIVVDGEVLECDPPRRLVQTWRMLMDEEMAAEGFTRLTYEIEPIEGGATKLTVVHELDHAPKLAELLSGGLEHTGAGGGWNWVLSDLKSLLETGEPLAAAA